MPSQSEELLAKALSINNIPCHEQSGLHFSGQK